MYISYIVKSWKAIHFEKNKHAKRMGQHSAMHCGLRFFEMTNVLHLSIVRKIVYLINNPFMPTT